MSEINNFSIDDDDEFGDFEEPITTSIPPIQQEIQETKEQNEEKEEKEEDIPSIKINENNESNNFEDFEGITNDSLIIPTTATTTTTTTITEINQQTSIDSIILEDNNSKEEKEKEEEEKEEKEEENIVIENQKEEKKEIEFLESNTTTLISNNENVSDNNLFGAFDEITTTTAPTEDLIQENISNPENNNIDNKFDSFEETTNISLNNIEEPSQQIISIPPDNNDDDFVINTSIDNNNDNNGNSNDNNENFDEFGGFEEPISSPIIPPIEFNQETPTTTNQIDNSNNNENENKNEYNNDNNDNNNNKYDALDDDNDEFGGFEEPTLVNSSIPATSTNESNFDDIQTNNNNDEFNNVHNDDNNQNQNQIDNNNNNNTFDDDEFGDFEETTFVSAQPVVTQDIKQEISSTEFSNNDNNNENNSNNENTVNDDEFGDFEESSTNIPISNPTITTTSTTIEENNATIINQSNNDDWGDFDEAPITTPQSVQVQDQHQDHVDIHAPPQIQVNNENIANSNENVSVNDNNNNNNIHNGNDNDDDDWGEFDEGSTNIQEQVTLSPKQDLTPLTQQEIVVLELETINKLFNLDKRTPSSNQDQILAILSSQLTLHDSIQSISPPIARTIQFIPSKRDSDSLINSYFPSRVNELPEILQNCCKSPTSDSFDWTLKQIHSVILNTIPSDAIDVSVLKERSYTKQYPLSPNRNTIQKKNDNTHSSQELESQLDGEENRDESNTVELDAGRRFSLTESNFPIQQTSSNRSMNNLKEYNENNDTNINTSTTTTTTTTTLSPAAEQFLKTLPDLSFMLITPYVENGKE